MRGSRVDPADPWDLAYRTLRPVERLWACEPTIADLDLPALRKRGIGSILDAGCGDGKNLAYLAAHGFEVVGLDASWCALQKCAAYLAADCLENLALLAVAELTSMPLGTNTISAAISIDVLGHARHPRKILAELARVVRRGGLLYTNLFDYDDSCRLGPRMQHLRDSEYEYEPSIGVRDASLQRYYYRFYRRSDVQALIEGLPLHLVDLSRRSWSEPGHTGYRDEPHVHASWFMLLERR